VVDHHLTVESPINLIYITRVGCKSKYQDQIHLNAMEDIMARDRSADNSANETAAATTDATTAATAQVAAANPTAAGNANLKSVKLLAPLGAPLNKEAGETVARKDFIRHRWTVDRVSRGQITKDLNAMNTIENGGDGKKIMYQVVFAVIKKGTPGGPVATADASGTQQGEGTTA
jgi:hypothetical protein